MKKIIIIILIFLFAFLIYYSGLIKPKCATDSCFNQALQKCSPASLTKIKNNNIYSYKISRSLFSKCNLKIKMEKAALGSEIEIKTLLEGRSMSCKIPKSKLKDININEMKDLLNYCSGPLKEGIYELMLKKMYSLVVGQMSGIIKKTESVLQTI